MCFFKMIFGQNVGKPCKFMLFMKEYCVQHKMFALEGAIKKVWGYN